MVAYAAIAIPVMLSRGVTKAVSILVVAMLFSCAEDRRVPQLEQRWQYTLTAPRATPLSDAAWTREVTPDGTRDLWLRNRLPARNARYLVFRAYAGELELFVETEKFYAFRDATKQGKLTLHVATLPRGAAGKHIYVRVPHARDRVLFGTSPFLATSETLPYALDRIAHAPIRADVFEIVTAFVLVIVGLIAMGASAIRRRGDALALRYFGLFTFLYGVRLGLGTHPTFILGMPPMTQAYLVSFITYVITIPGWLLGTRLIGRGWKSTLHWQIVAFAVFAPIAIASDLITRDPGSLDMVNNVLVITGLVNVAANVFYARRRGILELRVVLIGALLFLALALNNNLAGLGLVPSGEVEESIGFVIFAASLGFAATRSFIRGEREQIAIENELRTAREIQRSILPSTMPEVEGLWFHASYDPASSVAGDLYDFLRIDAHRIGVIVADVSGHGVPAALIASMVKVSVSSQARLAHDPAAMMRELDQTLRREVRREFVTATYLWFDMEHRSVEVTNAGHAPPLLFRSGMFLELGVPGPLLGRFANATRTTSKIALESGDRIVAFTDGIVEARDVRDEQFGEDRLKEIIRRCTDRDVAAVATEVFAAVHRWRGEDADDLTIVVIDVMRAT